MPYNNIKSEDIFKCQKCGDCCKGYGGTFITEKEIETIAAHIHTDSEMFVENYCQISGPGNKRSGTSAARGTNS